MPERMSELEAEALRNAGYWRGKYEELWDAVDNYLPLAPYSTRSRPAAARRELERVWLGEEQEA